MMRGSKFDYCELGFWYRSAASLGQSVDKAQASRSGVVRTTIKWLRKLLRTSTLDGTRGHQSLEVCILNKYNRKSVFLNRHAHSCSFANIIVRGLKKEEAS